MYKINAGSQGKRDRLARKKILVRNLYLEQVFEFRLYQGERRSVKCGTGVRKWCCFFFVHSVQNFKASNLPRKALKDMENWKWEEKIIHCVKYSDYLVLLAVQGTAIHGMFDRINKIENMLWDGQKFVKSKVICTITLCNSVVPTRSVWQVILLPADRCGSPNHI